MHIVSKKAWFHSCYRVFYLLDTIHVKSATNDRKCILPNMPSFIFNNYQNMFKNIA